jgi:hypothetical protein
MVNRGQTRPRRRRPRGRRTVGDHGTGRGRAWRIESLNEPTDDDPTPPRHPSRGTVETNADGAGQGEVTFALSPRAQRPAHPVDAGLSPTARAPGRGNGREQKLEHGQSYPTIRIASTFRRRPRRAKIVLSDLEITQPVPEA